MSALVQIGIAFGSVGVLMAMMALIRHVSHNKNLSSELQRKLVHVGTGLYALVLPWVFADSWPVYLLGGLSVVVMLVLRLPNSRLGQTLHSVNRRSYGDLLLAASVGICLFLAEDQLFLYVLPIAVLTLGDAAAALAGTKYGTQFFNVEEGRKSFEGSAVFFLVTLLISMMCLMLMTQLAPANIIVLSLMVAGFGTVVEATSWQGFDNLFLPLGILIFLDVHSSSSLAELILIAGAFAIGTFAFKLIAPKLGLSRHAASAYVTAVFLILAVTAFQNTILPILILVAHAWSRSAAPCKSQFPNLDIVAGLALISFGWLVLGNATGQNAVAFYGMTAMGLIMGFSAMALSARPRILAGVVLLAIAVVLCVIRAAVIDLNPEFTNWNGAMWPVVTATLLLTAMAPLLLPTAFDHRRVAKLTLLALVVPLCSYLFSIDLTGVFL